MGNFLVRYASRVVIYNCRAVIRLATGVQITDIGTNGLMTTLLMDLRCRKMRTTKYNEFLNGSFLPLPKMIKMGHFAAGTK